MASNEGHCPYCAKVFGAESERSKATHVGICRAKHGRLRDEQKRHVDAEESADAKRRKVAMEVQLPLVPIEQATRADLTALSETDIRWLELYLNRHDLSSSLLDDILPLCGDSTRFSSAAAFFAMVDSLPGPTFRLSRVMLPTTPPREFHFVYRQVTDIVEGLVLRYNGHFLDPTLAGVDGAESRDVDFVDGERFRGLQRKLAEVAGDGAVLMPLTFSSGTLCAIVCLVFDDASSPCVLWVLP